MKAITQKMHLGNHTQKFAYSFGGIRNPLCNSCPRVHGCIANYLKLSGLEQERFIISCSFVVQEFRMSLA